MSRYDDAKILRDQSGKRYQKNIKYPSIPISSSDIYIIAIIGDSVDLLSYEYYNTVEDYWIIMVANNLSGDSRYIKPGTQIRIPKNIQDIKLDFQNLNK